jgi:nicotinamidase-related amidase
MSSEPIRDQITDHLLTPMNAVLIMIDYQPTQVNSIRSMDRQELVQNSVRVAQIASTYELPIILSTVNVKSGRNQPTIPELLEVLPNIPQIDRTTINAWEDVAFKSAVEATGRKKLMMAALWTEACLSFPTLDALREGYDVYPVADAVGGTSQEAHETALERMVQAGAQPTSWVQLACELQRDWARTKTAGVFADILFGKPKTNVLSN